MRDAPRYRRLFDLRLGGRRRSDDELDLELESHVAMRVADLVRQGMPPDAARAEALARFGDFEQARARLRHGAAQRDKSARTRDRFGALAADVRYAIRQARRAPGFTTLAIATLALGIGATTTIFTLVDHVLLKPLPFAHPERLVAIYSLDSSGNPVSSISSADWFDWRRATTLDGSALASFTYRAGLLTPDSALGVDADKVSGNFFAVLQPRFIAGRPFTEHDEATPEVVISERLWRELFGADPHLASPLRTSAGSFTITGVVASGNEFPAGTDVWFRANLTPATDPSRININWQHIGRLAPGVTAQRAVADLTTIARHIHQSDPSARYDFGAMIEPLWSTVVGYASTYLKLLMGVVGFVLLVVCANVAAAALARSAVRAREVAVRASLGASRARIAQQVLIEHAWLGLTGGAFGLGLAWAAVHGILAVWGEQIPRGPEVSLDAGVLAFAIAASLLAGALAGIVPTMRLARVSLRDVLSSGGRTSARGGRHVATTALVGGEIALAFLLLIGAGLLIRSFRALVGRGLGFDTNVATAEAGLGAQRYATDSLRRVQYWDALVDSYRGIPGVDAVAVSNWIPLGLTGQGFVDIAGRDVPDAGAVYRTVSEDFFRALSIPLLAGRVFDRAHDGPATPRVAVINRRMAEMYWPGANPIGQLVRARSMEHGPNGQPPAWLTVVGIVGDIRTYGLETDPRPEMYVLFRQVPSWTNRMTVLVHGRTAAAALLPAMRAHAWALDPTVAVDVGTLGFRLRDMLATRTLTVSLLTGFAVLALVVAALGVYGVLSYAVAQRTRELAVRAALGARRGQLLALVFREGMRVVIPGIVIGGLAAFWLTRALTSMLVGVTTTDAATYLTAAIVLGAAACCAIIVPSVRATRSDPASALQAE